MDYDALERLGRLRDEGVLSNDEFAEQKKRLLVPGANNAAGAASSSSEVARPRQSFNLAHALTDRLGLEKVEDFSVRSFFGDVLKSKHPDDVEQHLCVGYGITTPNVTSAMAKMPSPWLFGRMLIVTLAVFLPIYLAYAESGNPLLIPALIMVGSFAVPLSVVVLFFELNTPRNVSMTRLAYLFMMGAAASLLISTILFEATPLLGVLGPPAAGLIEESGKVAALAFVTRKLDVTRYPYALNGLLFGAAVGAGFAAFESAGYAFMFGIARGHDAMMEVIIYRGVLSPFAHVAWTAMTGYAFWKLKAQGRGPGDIVTDPHFLKVFGSAIALHFVWNMDFTGPMGVKYVILGLAAWVIIISLVQSGLREIARQAASVEGEPAHDFATVAGAR